MAIELIPIQKDGTIESVDPQQHAALSAILPEIIANYERAGFLEPWIAYVAMLDQVCVGTCAFKAPPSGQRVEIAYFTFPQFEDHGYATQMAQCLVQIAQDTDDTVQVFARTLPVEGASARVLTKNGFKKTDEVLHPEDGLVWEWEYRRP
ncbi:MAG: GNAT family N-acetyltransferase [Candidatus Pacebacteria bacterium]|nr:GNAT family N-acetyltransferase [Candidatus Paceibacterota bacterium]